jgi:hypothetical protein
MATRKLPDRAYKVARVNVMTRKPAKVDIELMHTRVAKVSGFH